MHFPVHHQDVHFGQAGIRLLLPDPEAVRRAYQRGAIPFPYWSRIWPAATALCGYLADHPELVRGKQVVEIAAGLGLPSLIAARLGARVWTSDADPMAVEWIRASAAANGLHQLEAAVWNWNEPAPLPKADLLLLSDVNYAPEDFPALQALIRAIREQGTPILLATPQRLMAKPFITRLLSEVDGEETRFVEEVAITILRLR